MAQNHLKLPELTPQDILRFWNKVNKKTDAECWPWIAGKDWDNYGVFRVNYPRRVCHRAHRIAYFLHYKDDPGKLVVRHQVCDNPPCCNPLHLTKGTIAENNHDAAVKGRTAKGNKNGARLYPERLARGSAVHGSRLQEYEVLAIRELYLNVKNCAEIARMYSVNKSTIERIIARRTWAHI